MTPPCAALRLPPKGGQHLWPGKAGSTVFLDPDTSCLHP